MLVQPLHCLVCLQSSISQTKIIYTSLELLQIKSATNGGRHNVEEHITSSKLSTAFGLMHGDYTLLENKP